MPAVTGNAILIVEDQIAMRYLLETFLGRTYEVVSCRDGLEAFSWLAVGNVPALVVLDLAMPRLDGMTFLTQLRSSGWYREVPVIVVSADGAEMDAQQCAQLNVADVLVKPFDPKRLLQTVDQILHKSSVPL